MGLLLRVLGLARFVACAAGGLAGLGFTLMVVLQARACLCAALRSVR
jgi:hypothetical protein